jgi:peptidoglycan/xylan/chitin deacetylase (PgdA/CDA1 family)
MHLVSLLFHDVYRSDPTESGFCSPGADRYKLTAPRFAAQLDGVAAARDDRPILATSYVVSGFPPPPKASARLAEAPCGREGGRRTVDGGAENGEFPFLITVDDGGVSYRSVIADELEERGWRGHAFVSTDCIGRPGFLTAAQLRDLDARGHVIGSHSASHPTRFSACTRDEMVEEWRRSRQALEDLLGHAVPIASLPGGYFSSTVAQAAAEAGLRVLFTSEPVTRTQTDGACTIIGRYAVRAGADDGFSRKLVEDARWTRSEEWASWQMKGLLKPLLGPLYSRLADRVVPLLSRSST